MKFTLYEKWNKIIEQKQNELDQLHAKNWEFKEKYDEMQRVLQQLISEKEVLNPILLKSWNLI